MRTLTMESIANSMKGLSIFSAVAAVIFLAIGITVLVVTQKKVQARNRAKEVGESLDGYISDLTERILTPISCLVIMLGLLFVSMAITNSQYNDFTVETTTIVDMDWNMSKTTKGSSKTRYYMTFDNGMKKKVSEGTYRAASVGDTYYLVLNKRNKIIHMYSGNEYFFEN